MCGYIHFNNILCIFVEIMYNPKLGAVRKSFLRCQRLTYDWDVLVSVPTGRYENYWRLL